MGTVIYKPKLLSRESVSYPVPVGSNLAEWLMENLPPASGGTLKVFEGSVSLKNEMPVDDLVKRRVTSGELFIVVPVPGADWVIYGIILILAVGAAILLRPNIPLPQNNNPIQDKPSPNNAISGKTNELRPGARVPDILGKVRSYPDLLSPSYDVWFGNRQEVTEFFAVGLGKYTIEDSKLGDSQVASFGSAQLSFYGPGKEEHYPTGLLYVQRSAQVDDLPVFASNEINSEPVTVWFYTTGGVKEIWADSRLATVPGEILLLFNTDIPANDNGYELIAAPTLGTNPLTSAPNHYRHTVRTSPAATSTVFGSDADFETVVQIGTPRFWSVYSASEPNVLTFGQTSQSFRWKFAVGDLVYVHHINEAIATGSSNPPNISIGDPVASDFDLVKLGVYRIVEIGELLKTSSQGYLFYVTFESMSGGSPGFIPHTGYRYFFLIKLRPPLAESWSELYASPGKDPDELWVDIDCPQGLYTQNLGATSTGENQKKVYTFEVEIEIFASGDGINPRTDVPSILKSVSFMEKSVSSLRWTNKFSTEALALDVPGFRSPFYLVRVRRAGIRTFSTTTNITNDEVRLSTFRSAFYVLGNSYEGVTTAILVLQSSSRLASIEDRTLNMVVTRNLPTQNTLAPQTMTSSLVATQRWADAFIYRATSLDGGRLSINNVDILGIYDIQKRLDALELGEAGQLNGTLDTFNDVNKELIVLADAVRCVPYRIGSKLYVARDDDYQKTATTLYNRRNKAPNSETLRMEFQEPDSFDAIEFDYLDSALRHRSLSFFYNSSGVNPPTLPVNPKRVSGFGITNWSQAYRRAAFEWEKIRRRKDYLTLEVMEDPRLMAPLDVVKNVDNADLRNQYDGEVVRVSPVAGLAGYYDVVLDQPMVFSTTGEAHYILIRDQLLEKILTFVALPTADSRTVQVYAPVAEDAANLIGLEARDGGLGALYSFAAASSEAARDYLLMSADVSSNGMMQLSLVRYDPAVYTHDRDGLPARPDLLL